MFGGKKSEGENKIVQLIRTWYYKNGKSIDEIIFELREKWGLGEDQIRELLIRSGITSSPEETANLPEGRRLSAAEYLTLKNIDVPQMKGLSPSVAVSEVTSAQIKKMIDSAIQELDSKYEKIFKMIDKNYKELLEKISLLSNDVNLLKKDLNNLKQQFDDKAIVAIINKLKSAINNIEDKIDTIKLLMEENLNTIDSLKHYQITSSIEKEIENIENKTDSKQEVKNEEKTPDIDDKKKEYEELIDDILSEDSEKEKTKEDEGKSELQSQKTNEEKNIKELEKEICEVMKILEE